MVYSLRPDARLAIVTYRMQPNFEEWSRTLRQLFSEPAFERGFSILFDRSRVLHPASVQYLEQAVKFLDEHIVNGTIRRWAAVAGDLASFGMGRMAEQITNCDDSNRSFHNTAEAEAWLLSA